MKLYEPFQFLTDQECDQLISYAYKNNIIAGRTLGKSTKRKNRIVWYKESHQWQKWIDMFNSIDNCIDWIQDPQISFYKPGEKYDWHVDTTPKHRTHIRFFTLICELQTAPDSQLQLQKHTYSPLSKGQAIIFKPEDEHRATTPLSGERISFTIWAMAKNVTKH